MPVIRPKRVQRRRKPAEARRLPRYKRLGAAAANYWKVIAIGICALLLLFGAYVGWYMYKENRENKAATALARVNDEIAELLEKIAEEAESPEDINEEEVFGEAIDKYEEVADRYGDTKAGRLAKYEMANLYFELGEMDEARDNYEDAGRGGGDMKVLAGLGIADTYLAEGEDEKAAEYYEKVRRESAGAFPYVYATLKLAQVREEKGDLEAAKGFYREIIDYYTGSPFAEDAAEGLVRVEAKEELGAD
jgi:TolA-binding protein